MKTSMTLCVMFLLALNVLAVGTTAQAIAVKYHTVYINNQFEDETTNTANDTPNAGYVTGRSPTLTGAYSSTGATFTIPGPTTGPGVVQRPTNVTNSTTAGGRNVTVFTNGTAGHASQSAGIYSHPSGYGGGNEGRMQVASGGAGTPFAGTTYGSYIFSFDLSLPSTFAGIPTPDTAAWQIIPGISLQSNYGSTSPFGNPGTDLFKVRFSSGNLVVDHQGGTQVLVSGYTPNSVYSISTVANMDNDQFTIAVNGVQVGGVLNMLAPTNPLSNQGIGGYLIRGGSTSSTQAPDQFVMYVDNIFLASTPTFVPEPGSGLMLCLGMVGLIVRRRRRG